VELQEIERVAESMRDAVRRYAEILTNVAGGDLAGLTLYGTVLAPSFDQARHTVRNIVVLRQVDLKVLRDLAQHGARLAKTGIAAPMIMPPAYIGESLDTFPLEFLEIQLQHATLLGEDYFADLTFEAEHLRLQCERELKVLLIGMRQGLLASGGDGKQLGHLEDRAVETLTRILRGLLWLKGERDALDPLQLITHSEGVLQRELPAVRAVAGSAAGRGWDQFVGLYEDLEVLRELINGM
jgi:hypothetical protein